MKQNSASTYRFLNILPFRNLPNWSASFILGNKLGYNDVYPLMRIGKLLLKNKQKVFVDNNVLYKQVKVKLYGKGVELRGSLKGIEIGTKNQFLASKGQFIMSKIDARNGAFGIIPEELEGAIVTQDFLTYNINNEIVLPDFFLLITTTREFHALCQRASSGTTNRQRVDENAFLNFEIPVPSISEQEKLLSNYNQNLASALRFEVSAKNTIRQVENLFLEKLGVKPFVIDKSAKGLKIINYSFLERWDFFSIDTKILNDLKKSLFELKPLGLSYNFINRSWNKTEHSLPTFRYVEIGAIDPLFGITEAKEIETKRAPSRATQVIKTGDLLIATTRPYLKKFVIVPPEFDDCICSSGFSVIEPSTEYNLYFLKEFLMCSYGIEQLKSKMTGALYPAITEGELKDVKISFPDVEIQNEIMEMVNSKRQEIIHAKEQAEILKAEAIMIFEQAIFQ